MGTLFEPDYSDVLAVAIAKNGNITAISEHFKISKETFYQFIKRDPKGKEIIDKVRAVNTETQLDLAEHVILYNMMNFKTNPGLAQRAAEKVIDKKGHLRGWETKTQSDEMIEMIITDATSSNTTQV
jgi:hypothetical protein